MPTNRIDSIHIEGIPPISEVMDLTLNPRVNLLIGPNGCGKSTVLRTIVASLQDPKYRSMRPNRTRSVQIELQYECKEIANVRTTPHERPNDWSGYREHNGPGERSIFNYHDQEFSRALSDYYGLADGDGQFLDRINELPERLKVPFVFIPATRLPFPRKDDIVSAYVLSEDNAGDDVFDSRRAFRSMERFENPDPGPDRATMTTEEYFLFNARENAAQWEQENGEPWENALLAKLREAASARKDALIKTTVTCAARICSEILKPQALSEYSHSTESGLRGERGIQQVGYAHWRPHTRDRSDAPMTIGELSAGTQGPLMWIWHLVVELHDFFVTTHRHRLTHHKFRRVEQFVRYVREDENVTYIDEWLTPEQYAEKGCPHGYVEQMVDRVTDEVLSWEEYRDLGAPRDYCAEPTPLPEEAPDEWRRMPFILVIDEIENHLHPAWQRRVIPALLETFPRMQLIATTHSPFVVAGREAGQVHRLFRDDDGIVRAETSDEDIVGWTVEDILREFMEIEDPTDDYTAVAATVLRWLRKQEPEEGEAAEVWRKKHIEQLSIADSRPSVRDLVVLGWLERLPTLSGAALEWWEHQIEHLGEQVSPNVEFRGHVNADRERYIAELEEMLEERFGEDFLVD